jgi:multiple sugar transport system permease protein
VPVTPSPSIAQPARTLSAALERRRAGSAQNRAGWLLSAPAVAILAALTIAPAAYLLYSSLFRFTLLGSTRQFVGLGNYTNLLSDGTTVHDFLVTLMFVAIVVSIEMVLGLALAIPLSARTMGNSVASTLLILPFAITPAVSALVWRQLLDPNFGWIDYYAQKLGIMGAPVQWLSGSGTSWVAIVGIDVWQWTPFVALVLMAGLQGVPAEPREAAAVDGATAWQTFRYVTLPALGPFIAIALLLRLVEAFKTFATIDVLTGGGPGRSTELISLSIYRTALENFSIGAAAAMGVAFLILVLVVVTSVMRLATRGGDLFEELA